VCGVKEVVRNIKVTSNNNNNKHRSNLGTKCKAQDYNQKIKERRETMTYSRG